MAKKSASIGARNSPKKAAPASESAPTAKKPRAQKTAIQKSKAAKPDAEKKQPAAKSKPAPAGTKTKSSPAKHAGTSKAAASTTPAAPAKPFKSAKPAASADTRIKAPITQSSKKSGLIIEPAIESHAPVPAPSDAPVSSRFDDPIGDTSDGEGRVYMHGAEPEAQAEMAAYRADTAEDALEGTLPSTPRSKAKNKAPKKIKSSSSAIEAEPSAESAPSSGLSLVEPRAREEQPAHLDRLQKILSQAGIASRRHAEEMILAGRVVVNGQVVNQLGAKADRERDHIRVDGKHIPAPERHRYFVLNKPRGYVTTVSDPEGRPTVMQFFTQMRERLYPVGRLDYESEGLLLVTNDGELANQLTRAASGVEKTYLVKVAGRPTEEELNRLRSGVFIERTGPGSDEAQTAPARIRELHHGGKSPSARQAALTHGENPWYEVVLIEGRNRELRKMFQSVGHFVEKIRRVGYGPLILDLPPGQLRELEPEELARLRRTAEGKGKPSRPKTAPNAEDTLPREAGGAQAQRAFKPGSREGKPFREQSARRDKPEWKPREPRFGQREGKPAFGPRGDRPRGQSTGYSQRPGSSERPASSERGGRPNFGKPQSFGKPPTFGKPPSFGKPQFDRPRGAKPGFDKPQFDRPERPRPASGESNFREGSSFRPRPQSGGRTFGSRPQPREGGQPFEERAGSGPRPQGDRPSFQRGGFKRTDAPQKRFDRPAGGGFSKPRGEGFTARPPARFGKPAGTGFSKPRGEGFKPPSEGFKPRGEGKPRSEGFKPRSAGFSDRPSGRFDRPSGSRSQGPPRDQDRQSPQGRQGSQSPGRDQSPPREWNRDREQRPAPFRGKPKPRFGSQSKPAGGRSKPAFGGKPNFKRSGPPRSGGNRPGGRKRG
jgi:23S rRNA pseudouridine2605 synthase